MRRLRLGTFPAVSERSFREGRSYNALWERWRQSEHVGLRIIATLASPVLPGPEAGLHLDGILAAALMSSAMVGPTVSRQDNFVVPLPLSLAWVDGAGRPLWLATQLRPFGVSTEAEIYIHKRYPTDRATLAARTGVLTTAGRYKDVRMPLRAVAADRLIGWCLGVEGDIRALLDGVTHIGRKGAIGGGRVISWEVTRDEVDADWIMDRRTVPLDALADAPVAASRVSPRDGWTPPYWDARLHSPCRAAAWTP